MNRPNLRYLLALLIGAVFICSVILVVLDTRPGLKAGSFWSPPSEQETDPSVILSHYRNWDSLGVLIFLLLISTGVSLLLPRGVSLERSDCQPLSVPVFVLLVIGFTLVFQSRALTGGVVLGVFALRLFIRSGGSVRIWLELVAVLSILGLLVLGLFGLYRGEAFISVRGAWNGLVFDILLGLGVGAALSSVVHTLEESR